MNTFLRLFTYIKQQVAQRITTRSLFIVVLFMAGLVPDKVVGEGSDELCAMLNGETHLYLCNDFITNCNQNRSHFAVYGCNVEDRLNFVIQSSSEIVYFGLNWQNYGGNFDNVVFRVKNNLGVPVFPETNIPSSGIGYIGTLSAARNGPNQIVGTGGYDAFEITNLPPGTYYIEFDGRRLGNPNYKDSWRMKYIDLTVLNTSTNLVEPGRLFSKGWQFIESQPNQFSWYTNSSTFYIYSTDQIITSVTFDEMEGRAWLMFCNATGCANTGNFTQDRKSLYQEQAYVPEYNIFLNEPDADLFPPASTLGEIIGVPWGDPFCDDGSILFHVEVDKAGNAEVNLTFPSPYVSINIPMAVVAGENLILWDGNDGMGNPIPNNIIVTFFVTYINGLTHLPLYDIEANDNGFRIELVAPASPDAPIVFWDDSNIPGGTTNFTGCNSTPPNNGCHVFGYGDQNTINTWWWTSFQSTEDAYITEIRRPQLMVFNQVPPQEYCAGSNGNAFSVAQDLNTDVYHWNYTGTGATITPNVSSPWQVTVNFAAGATNGFLEVYGTNANCTDPGPTAQLAITIIPVATANAGSDASVCAGSGYTMTDASSTGLPPYFWTTATPDPGGSWSPNNTVLLPTYTPGPTAIANESIVLSLTAFSSAPCEAAATDLMTLSIEPAPTADAGSYSTLNVCENGSFSLDGATTNNSSSVQWSTSGDGVFVPDEFTIQPSYEPGVADAAAGTVTLTLTAHGDGACTIDAQDFIALTIDPLPTADAGTYADNTVCETGT
ncbi:MAG: hypothetical protein COW63_00960, partial [Bacteroidetes bacterium CG18_big_fil_WC_8_21_14_2_50_41_14]